ncbi:MAG: hypothetical protein JJ938_16865 [Roseicyclus sp.]|nr:hypothetical protein [Roseicyclus sp.]MBO6626548.1 hypothetical protein [Roseicyclus sp.]MBO6923285.1 hypothetical protein [Roseicyclus sp.]
MRTQSLRTLHSDQHQRIVDAIERDDAEGASMKMTEHRETIGADTSGAARSRFFATANGATPR